jgi:hypothetical protein
VCVARLRSFPSFSLFPSLPLIPIPLFTFLPLVSPSSRRTDLPSTRRTGSVTIPKPWTSLVSRSSQSKRFSIWSWPSVSLRMATLLASSKSRTRGSAFTSRRSTCAFLCSCPFLLARPNPHFLPCLSATTRRATPLTSLDKTLALMTPVSALPSTLRSWRSTLALA